MKRIILYTIAALLCMNISAIEYHVAQNGDDKNPGTSEKPFLTIQAAANIALPGDTITVHQGVYREWVKPIRGGTSDENRIIYRAAENEIAEIKGSEIVKGWQNLTGSVWRIALPDSFFNGYNPYRDLIHGDWFNSLGKIHHTGEVYLNGKSLWEASLLEEVLHPKKQDNKFDAEGSLLTWYCESDTETTFIYANFQGTDPNAELVEINVRKSCFYPEATRINYITVTGFHMSQAATQWAPPTAEQIGLIGTNWSKGWKIENNTISDSKCSGITLGKHGDEFDNTSENSAEGYVETIHRAIERGWSRENIGSHIVRNNTIHSCEQTGICGSLGAIFSTIENNNIYNIWVKRQFTGAEMGGIKIHAAIDMLIRNNRLANCGRGLWLDWMAQGTHVYGNLLYNNTTDDLFVEVNHGPFVIENNLFLSELSLRDWSEGGAYVHNLFAGTIEMKPQNRLTPYHRPHSTKLAGLKETRGGDNRFYNNIFAGNYPDKPGRQSGLKIYENSYFSIFADGNIYLNHAQPATGENNYLHQDMHPGISVSEENNQVYISFAFNTNFDKVKTQTINTEILGKTIVAGAVFEGHDGTAIIIDKDYFKKPRNPQKPIPGPFANTWQNQYRIKVW